MPAKFTGHDAPIYGFFAGRRSATYFIVFTGVGPTDEVALAGVPVGAGGIGMLTQLAAYIDTEHGSTTLAPTVGDASGWTANTIDELVPAPTTPARNINVQGPSPINFVAPVATTSQDTATVYLKLAPDAGTADGRARLVFVEGHYTGAP